MAARTGTSGADGAEGVSGTAETGADGQGPEAALRGQGPPQSAVLQPPRRALRPLC